VSESLDFLETTALADQTFALDGYSGIRKIGMGGMATVYGAVQQNFDRKVAIKVLLPAYASDPEFAQRFLREAQTVSKLSHPHIIPVFDFGQRDGTFYMVMEYMAGGDLATWIQRGLAEDEMLAILSDIASALHFAHEKGFVHRDVKPDNIMFREDNSALLTDFGIARKQSSENQMTVAGQILGTPKYMSPEQLQGRELDGRSDIYSLGIVLYEMLCKQPPYQDDDFMALAMLHIQSPIPRLPAQFSKYQKLFERMVAKQPEHRFQTGLEIVKLIQQIRSGKVEAGSIDSGSAAAMKNSMQTDEGELAGETKVVRLSGNVMVDLNDVDPLLNLNWNGVVSAIFPTLNAAQRKFVYAQILKPKGILYDAPNKEFVFYGRPTVADVLGGGVSNPALEVIAKKLLEAEQSLRVTRDTKVFADMMESSLSAVDRFNSEENLALQKEKMALRAAFLDDLVTIIRNVPFDLPSNKRSLTVEGIKAYMLEVYIKQQMIGYRFKTMSIGALERDEHDFLRLVVAKEARTRQCDIVRTDDYLYLIGPVREVGQNPYSIRRFLHEDEGLGGQVVYFNAVSIPLSKIDIPQAQETIQWLMSRIVTLERQLSQGVFNFVAGLEKTRDQYLTPILSNSIVADGSNIEQTIETRLIDFEKKSALLMLSKVPKALTDLAKTLDEFEYLFFSLRKLIIELACEVRDFSTQSAAAWSPKAEELDLKMMSFINLLDKRKSSLFAVARPAADDPAQDHTLLVDELSNTLDQHEQELAALVVKLKESIRKQEIVKTGFQLFMEKIFGPPKKKDATPDEIQGLISATKRKCLLSIIRVVKRYPKITVYLELEDIITVNESIRHYGLSVGKDGIGKLPVLLTLYENAEQLDIAGMRQALKEAEAAN
jgi:serine/threonine-protein kinase PpkA